VKDGERSGRPTTSRTDDITAVDKMVKEDRNVTSRLIADTMGIPKTVVLRILREDLKKRKLHSRFVPHEPTREQMDERVAAWQDLSNMTNGDKNFLEKVIARRRPGAFGNNNSTVSDSKTSRNIEPPHTRQICLPRLLSVPEGEVAVERCKI